MFPFQLCVFLSFQPSIFPGVVSFSPGGVRHPSSQSFLFLEPFIQASFFVEAKRSLEKLLKLFKARCVFIIENPWKSKVFFKPQTWEQCFWKCWWWKKQCITCDVMKLWNRHECGIYINILIYYIYIYINLYYWIAPFYVFQKQLVQDIFLNGNRRLCVNRL